MTGRRTYAATVVLVLVMLLGVAAPAAAKPPRTSSSTVAQIIAIQCAGTTPTDVEYQVLSTVSSTGVEVRWRLSNGQMVEVGVTYLVHTYAAIPTNTVLTAPAPTPPSGYSVVEAVVVPINKSGRQAGTADSERVTCPSP